MKTYNCSICEKTVEYADKLPDVYPFCCERCRLLDLGKWFREEYSIDRDLTADDVAESPESLDPPQPPRSL